MFKLVEIDKIVIPIERQRKFVDQSKVNDLEASIKEHGLLQPLIVDETGLVAGFRRLQAIKQLLSVGEKLRFSGEELAWGLVPCISLKELSLENRFAIELEENIIREDLTWQERCSALKRLFSFRKSQDDSYKATDIATDIYGRDDGWYGNSIRKQLIVAQHINDPSIKKQKTVDDAFKLLLQQERRQVFERAGEKLSTESIYDKYTLQVGDFRSFKVPLFDVLITDPPYLSLGKMTQNNSGATGPVDPNFTHSYMVSKEEWHSLMETLATSSYERSRPRAHAYVFCAYDDFPILRDYFRKAMWKVFPTPLLWVKDMCAARHVPWPQHGPRRGYECILYALKGGKPLQALGQLDYIFAASDSNLGHPAQKPVSLFVELLKRSVLPFDTVYDPFCGTGTVFPAAYSLCCQAIGCELDLTYAAIAKSRIDAISTEGVVE